MSAQAISYVWGIEGVTAEERLILIWIANNSAGLGYAVCPEWIGMGKFIGCDHERAFDVASGLADKGLLRWGSEEDETSSYLWITYDGEYQAPIDWTVEAKGRSGRVAALIERDGPNCVYCDGVPVNYHVDHFIPKARGGRDAMDNLVLACPGCNLAKRDKDPEEFLKDEPRRLHVIKTNLKYLHE